MKIGLAASADTLRGVADTPPLLRAAADAGIEIRVVDWRADASEWDWADAILLHSPWDYIQHLDEFDGWLRSMSDSKPVFNPWSRIASNTHKGYLVELMDAGVPVPLTRLLLAGRVIQNDDLQSFGSAPVVVKPAVGSGGRRLARLAEVGELKASPFLDASGAPGEDLVVQAFVPSVELHGEYSLVMVGGRPTHLVHKIPAAGQFRVQARFGGRTERVAADDAARAMEQMTRPHIEGLAYARIDYVLDESGAPLLMELEATEPDLFLQHAPEAAAALVRYVGDHATA